MSEDLVLKAVDIASGEGAEYAEARYQIDEVYQIIFRNGKLEVYGYSVNEGISVRTLVKGSMGFATTDILNLEEVSHVAKHSVKLARAQGSGKISLSEEEVVDAKYSVDPKIGFEDVSLEEKLEVLKKIDEAILDAAKGVKIPTRSIFVTYVKTSKIIATNEGTIVRSLVPRLRLTSYKVLANGNRSITRFVNFGEARGWEAVEEWKPWDRISENVAALKKVLLEAESVRSGWYDIILGPETSGLAAHESCGHPFELDRILGREGAQAGESFVTLDMLGKKIARDIVTVIDDPTIPNSYGYYLYDEEGVRARPRYLIKNGVINEFLMNRETAAVIGAKSNAASRASAYNREPIVRMANTYFAPGDHSFEELLEDVKRGIYIKSFGEWNIDDRRYNMRFVGQEAYYIENGELKKPVWSPIFEITTPKFYENIDAVDKNLYFDPATCGKSDPGQGVPVFTGGPNVRVRNVYVFETV